MKTLSLLSIIFLSSIASADETLVSRECDDQTPTSLEFFVQNKAFANGKVRVFHVDTEGEPACCSSHLVIYVDIPNDEGPLSKCVHIASDKDGRGFLGTNLDAIKSSYSTKTGLKLNIPVSFYNYEEGGKPISRRFTLDIDQSTSKVTIK